jgi:hypothetical protein
MTVAAEEDGERSYVCEACGKSFESEAALEAHLRDVGLVD